MAQRFSIKIENVITEITNRFWSSETAVMNLLAIVIGAGTSAVNLHAGRR